MNLCKSGSAIAVSTGNYGSTPIVASGSDDYDFTCNPYGSIDLDITGTKGSLVFSRSSILKLTISCN